MNTYQDIAVAIIRAQETVIGPVALMQAKEVEELSVDWDKKEVQLKGDGKMAIDHLISSYKMLFGQISVDVCKEAAARLVGQLSAEELPALLR